MRPTSAAIRRWTTSSTRSPTKRTTPRPRPSSRARSAWKSTTASDGLLDAGGRNGRPRVAAREALLHWGKLHWGDHLKSEVALPQPYLLFLGDTTEPGYAKTAFGLRDWAGERCVGEYVIDGATVSTGLASLTPEEAAAAGAKAIVIGVANSGGFIPLSWRPALVRAMEAGLDIVSGMHARLRDIEVLRVTAQRLGRRLIDVREP